MRTRPSSVKVEGQLPLRHAQNDGLRAIADLTPRARNPRTHSPKQIEQIAASIRRFGFINPVLIDSAGCIIAGHGRVEGAKLAGLTHVPVMRVEHLSEAEIRAYVIADNKLAENAGWDTELLALELRELSLEVDLDVSITGFETAEMDVLLSDEDGDNEDPPPPPVDRTTASTTRLGDIWEIGPHRLLCGNALDPTAYARLLGQKLAQCVFTDPPYNVPIEGHVSGKGRIRHGDFVMASGEMSPDQFSRFLETVFRNLVACSVDGSLHFQCMDWRHMSEILAAGQKAYTELKNLCVWAKSNAGMGSLYRSQHELIFVFKSGTGPHINNVQLGKHGRNRSNVWSYAGLNAFGAGRDSELALHPTVKPIAMVADAIMDATRRGDIVLDAFTGSGTTLLAAHKTGRVGHGIELDPHYVDQAVLRVQEALGLTACHAETKQSFEEVAATRRANIA
jgi:DNA modification methylase